AAGSIPRAESAEACQLLARAKAIKASDLGPQRGRRYQADAFNGHQLLDQGILARLTFQPLVHLTKFLLKGLQAAQPTAGDMPGVGAQIRTRLQPGQPSLGPRVYIRGSLLPSFTQRGPKLQFQVLTFLGQGLT